MPAAVSPSPGSSRTILILALAAFASTFAGRSLEPLVGVVARDLASDPGTVALLTAAYALPYAFIQPVLGPVGDALGKERVMTVCLGLLTVVLAACAFAPDLGVLFALRIVAGAAAGGIIPLVLAMMGDRVPIERRQVAIGRMLVATILGQLSGSTIAGLVESYIGWRGVLGLTGIIAGGGFAIAVIGLRGSLAGGERRFVFGEALARYRAILANPRARTLFCCVFVEAMAVFGMFPYLAPLIEGRGEGGPFEAGLVLAGFALGGLVYAALVGTLLRVLGIPRILVGGGAICALALLLVGVAGRWQLDMLALMLLGLGFYMLHNSFQVQVTEVAPTSRASAVSLHAFSFFCGQAISVAVFGLELRVLGQLGAFALCAVVVLVLGFVASRLLFGRGARV